MVIATLAVAGVLFAGPPIVRSLGTAVPAGQPYRWSDGSTVLVRAAYPQFCTVDRGGGRTERVDVRADSDAWATVHGTDIAGTDHATTTLTCERDSVMARGLARLAVSGYSHNYLLALACPVLLLAIIAYSIRILYTYKITRS